MEHNNDENIEIQSSQVEKEQSAQIPLIEVEVLPKLKEKQDTFFRRYYSNGRNATEAYRFAYDAQNSNSNTVWKEAHKLLKAPKFAPIRKKYEAEASEIVEKNFKFSILDAFNALAIAEELALNNKKVMLGKWGTVKQADAPDVSALIKVTELKCKLAGLMRNDEEKPLAPVESFKIVAIREGEIDV